MNNHESIMTEVKPRIFYLDFKDQYHCNMTFLRYQEFYESPNPKFRGKRFEILDFMEWYSKAYGKGAFTYGTDWAGFNVPGPIIKKALHDIPDPNRYDLDMEGTYLCCEDKYPDGKFYIIGGVGKGFALRHELAHGFFYTQPKYKREMTKLVKALPKKFYKSMCDDLTRIGYTPKVFIDECQAYLATGLPDTFKTRYQYYEPFVKLYNEYYKP